MISKKNGSEMVLDMEPTEDILKYLGDHKPKGQILCGFSMETKDMVRYAKEKLEKKHLDMIAANNVKTKGAGFAVDTNVLTLITQTEEVSLPLMKKEEAAAVLLSKLLDMTMAK